MRKNILQSCFAAILVASGFFSASAQDKAAFTSNWPEWRGLYNTGAVQGGNTPVEFSETKNVKWKIEIPGKDMPPQSFGEIRLSSKRLFQPTKR